MPTIGEGANAEREQRCGDVDEDLPTGHFRQPYRDHGAVNGTVTSRLSSGDTLSDSLQMAQTKPANSALEERTRDRAAHGALRAAGQVSPGFI
jgi:hypothetical protein